MFIWDNGKLTVEQEDAILDPDSVLLIACPGSGKTRTLIYKIAYELARLESEKKYIIAITYTNAAADEIKERVEILGVDTKQLWIGTIHSFCLEWILRPYSLYLNELKKGFKVLNSHDYEEMISNLCIPYADYRVTFWDFNYLATPTGYKITSLDVKKRPYLEEILVSYHDCLKTNRQIDFEQILFYSYQLLQSKPVIGSILSNIFPFILIDEYQDTKEIQYHIIASILRSGAGKTKTLIVGDPNQSIYETLAGYPMEKRDMEALFGISLKPYPLSANYRSSRKIINYFEYFKTFDNQIEPKGKLTDYDSTISHSKAAVSKLEDEIVNLIEFNIKDRAISPDEICIAGPQWVHLAALTRNLMVRLPDYSFNGPGMAPFARDIDNFWYKVARIILTEPSPELYIRRLRWAKEVLHELEEVGFCITYLTEKSFLKLCNSIVVDENQGLKFLKVFFNVLCEALVLDINVFDQLKEHYQSFFSSAESRIERLQRDGNQFIGTIDNFRKVFKQKEGIKISTIHGVKGTEFDTIIGFGLLDTWVPHFSDPNGFENSKKMLYVLSSRAKKNLHIISESGRNINRFNPEGLQPTCHLLDYHYSYDL